MLLFFIAPKKALIFFCVPIEIIFFDSCAANSATIDISFSFDINSFLMSSITNLNFLSKAPSAVLL